MDETIRDLITDVWVASAWAPHQDRIGQLGAERILTELDAAGYSVDLKPTLRKASARK